MSAYRLETFLPAAGPGFRQDGLEILDVIRSDPKIKHLSVVMVSGMNLREECMRRGATEFLLKPFMPQDLVATLKRVIPSR